MTRDASTESPSIDPKGHSRRDRSPNYPSITFKDALAIAEKIHRKEKRHAVSNNLASEYMGAKKANGTTLPKIAAMKQYGLLVPAEGGVRISDDAHEMFVHDDPDAPERRAIAKRLAMRPKLFGEVMAKFSDDLPSDASLRARLQNDWNFASSKAADAFIRALREAIALSGGGTPGAEPSRDNDGRTTEQEPRPMSAQHPITTATTPASKPAMHERENATQKRTWDLGGGDVASITIPATLSKKHLVRLRKYLDVLEKEAAILWDDEPSE